MKVKYSELISKVDPNKLKKLIGDALSLNNSLFKEIRKALPKKMKVNGFSSLSKVIFKAHRSLSNDVYKSDAYKSDDKLAKLLFKGYFLKNGDKAIVVRDALVNGGYKINDWISV